MSDLSQTSQRLISLDALRGFTIAGMVIVNDPGSWSHVYKPLLHADWDGITPTDLIFPFFLFMVGISITLAYTKRLKAGADKKALYKKIISRTIKILLLGWFLWLWPSFNFEGMRFAGVLPRIALVFFFCAVIFLNTNWKTQVLIGAFSLLFYWGIFEVIPVPLDEVNRQALETGMVDSASGMIPVNAEAVPEDGTPTHIKPNYEPGINITAWFDRQVLPGRFWQRTWDPEGLISTLPAIVTGLIGMLVGRIVIGKEEMFKKLTTLFFTGFALYLVAEMWAWVLPLNKNLWSSS